MKTKMQENLTSQERLERIARIINRGIYLLALKEGWFVSSDRVKKNKSQTALSQRQEIIMAQVKSRSSITNKEICGLLDISRDTVHRELKTLVKAGLLEVRGKGRASAYFKK